MNGSCGSIDVSQSSLMMGNLSLSCGCSWIPLTRELARSNCTSYRPLPLGYMHDSDTYASSCVLHMRAKCTPFTTYALMNCSFDLNLVFIIVCRPAIQLYVRLSHQRLWQKASCYQNISTVKSSLQLCIAINNNMTERAISATTIRDSIISFSAQISLLLRCLQLMHICSDDSGDHAHIAYIRLLQVIHMKSCLYDRSMNRGPSILTRCQMISYGYHISCKER